jgi:predicted 3-demethylubiquinone-9 3-methyltransferase (glyoxalase superfamily)
MANKLTTFLMFTGRAEEAMRFYVSLFPNSEIKQLEPWKAGEPGGGKEGTVKRGLIQVAGTDLMCFDSPPVHAFTFTPSTSLFVECESEAELDAAFAKLSEQGGVLMPPGNYGFSQKFAWLNDRFGMSWQLNLE